MNSAELSPKDNARVYFDQANILLVFSQTEPSEGDALGAGGILNEAFIMARQGLRELRTTPGLPKKQALKMARDCMYDSAEVFFPLDSKTI